MEGSITSGIKSGVDPPAEGKYNGESTSSTCRVFFQKTLRGKQLVKRENSAVVSFVAGSLACSEANQRRAPPLYDWLRLIDGGADPLRAWGNPFAPSSPSFGRQSRGPARPLSLPLFSFPRPPTEQQQQAVGRAEDGKKRRRRPCSGSGSSSRQRASGIRFVCPSSAGTSAWQAEAADRQCRRAVIRVAQEAQQGPIPRLPLPSSNQREDSSSAASNSWTLPNSPPPVHFREKKKRTEHVLMFLA